LVVLEFLSEFVRIVPVDFKPFEIICYFLYFLLVLKRELLMKVKLEDGDEMGLI